MLRVVVVGSGPAGVYAAAALLEHVGVDGPFDEVQVDVVERLPCPFGLVRYGVAPDHPKIRSVSGALGAVLADPRVRFLGNVEVGRDVSVSELLDHAHAVVLAYGASTDRILGVAGESLPGSTSATHFVGWYGGHPDVALDDFDLTQTGVAVVGAGNVALDVARILVRPADDLVGTNIPEHVLATLRTSRVTDVHIFARRGPLEAKFTTKELREFGALHDVDIRVDRSELDPLDSPQALAADATARRNLEGLHELADRRPVVEAARRLHIHWRRRPVEILGTDLVEGLTVELTEVSADGVAAGTGVFAEVPCGLVLRSVGYRGLPLQGVPFDDATATIPHDNGRVPGCDGVYVAGWIKRGPTGVIGTNKHDAHVTVETLVADLAGRTRELPPRDALTDLLAQRGVDVVDWRGWLAIRDAEVALGQAAGRPQVTIAQRQRLLGIATRPATAAAGRHRRSAAD